MRRRLFNSELDSLIVKAIAIGFALLMPVVLGLSPKIFGDGDVSWHVAAGNWILANGRVPVADPFSFTMFGQPWVAFEWLSQIIYASAFNAAGYGGLSLVVIAALLGLHLALYTFLCRRVGLLVMVLAFTAMDFVLAPFLFARPHVLVWPILATWTAVLLKCRDQKRAPPIWFALLMLIWANLHGSFMLGLAIAGAVALDALIAQRWERPIFFAWFNFGLVALIAALLNANGLTGFFHPIDVMNLENLAFIDEWQPSTPKLTPYSYVVFISTLGLMILKRVRLSIGETVLLLFLLIMAFSQVRHQSWLAIVAPLILAPRFSESTSSGHHPLLTKAVGSTTTTLKAGLAASAILLAWWLVPSRPADTAGYPRSLLAHVPASLRSEPVMNGYSFGGPLILAGIRPYIDGRSDMYGDAFVADYFRIMSGDRARFEQAVCNYDIAWTILPPQSGLTVIVDSSRQWKRLYANRIGVIHMRQPTSNACRGGR